MSKQNIDRERRRFLGNAALTAGTAAVAVCLPLRAVSTEREDAAVAEANPDPLCSIDDACGHWPPYAHPIPYGPPAPDPWQMHVAAADPIDCSLMV